MPSSKNAISSQKNSRKNMTVERSVQSNNIVVKMNQPIKNNPNESRNVDDVPPPRAVTISKPPGVRMIANEIQKPPYEDKAVAPKVLPTAISHMPASNCTNPPYPNAAATTMFASAIPLVLMLIRLSTNVVNANALSPRGAGLASFFEGPL